MTEDQLIALHERMSCQALEIMKAKNDDYAHGDDPFRNFRMSSSLGISPVMGILLRVQDKLQRIRAFTERGELAVKDEPVEDALLDIINYCVLMRGIIEEGRPKKSKDSFVEEPLARGLANDPRAARWGG